MLDPFLIISESVCEPRVPLLENGLCQPSSTGILLNPKLDHHIPPLPSTLHDSCLTQNRHQRGLRCSGKHQEVQAPPPCCSGHLTLPAYLSLLCLDTPVPQSSTFSEFYATVWPSPHPVFSLSPVQLLPVARCGSHQGEFPCSLPMLGSGISQRPTH